jgi:hypothetical protein
MDWLAWHQRYEESPTLQARLALVRSQLSDALNACPTAAVRLISLCAGDGRDVIGTLANHNRAADTSAYLVELNPALVDHGQASVSRLHLGRQIHFITGDATRSSTYLSLVPADLLVVSGVFGNVHTAELPTMINRLRCLCRQGSVVIWTRSATGPAGQGAVTVIGEAFDASGFREVIKAATTPQGFIVATHQLVGEPLPLLPEQELFCFTDYTRL